MHLDVQCGALDGSSENSRFIGIPDKCPRCHVHVHPKFQMASKTENGSMGTGQAIFRCTNQSCQELFIATYQRTNVINDGRHSYKLLSISPVAPIEQNFPEAIAQISPVFVAVYNQAIHAESQDLDQLVGIGLRKALEFLIKDYASEKNRENQSKIDEIRRKQLGPCIDTFVEDSNIKQCAKRAVWLGNDETHVVRKWESKDISDLKALIRLTVNWIENEYLTRKYIDEMPLPEK
jgi:hypothetical protein